MVNLGATDVDAGILDARIYTDQEIYDTELEQVFGRTWLFLAHETQLPKVGSFVQTYMAEDPVVVVKQRDGSIKAFLNQCRHRGMRICRSDAGTAKIFTCSYHGWGYGLDGSLVNVPSEEIAYGDSLSKSQWGATPVPRVVNYKGFVFGTWSLDAPDFEEHLGDMKYYFDGQIDRYEGGVEFLGNATKWVIDCNWKLAAEQWASDTYHVPSSHVSSGYALTDIPEFQGLVGKIGQGESTAIQFTGNGHGTGNGKYPDGFNPQLGPIVSDWYMSQREQMNDRVGEDRRTTGWGHSTIFPNFSYFGVFHTFRVWHPRGPGQIEVWAWVAVPKNAPPAVKAEIRRYTAFQVSPAGILETDDGENWTEIQQVLRGWKARSSELNVRMGMGEEQTDNPVWPGKTTPKVFSEMASRGFYSHWKRLLLGTPWDEISRDSVEARDESMEFGR